MAEWLPMRVVIVEDEPVIAELLVEQCLRQGWRPVVVPPPFHVIDPAMFVDADIVISDFMLPGTTGCAVLRQAERVAPTARLVLWTAAPGRAKRDPACADLHVVVKPASVVLWLLEQMGSDRD